MTDERPKQTLAATCRCLTEDLSFDPSDCQRPIGSLTHNEVIRAFMERRSQQPEGQERIQSIRTEMRVFSLHVGRGRGATWHELTLDVIWLLAYGIHRKDSPEDAYNYFAQLHNSGRLRPTVDDVIRVLELRQPTFEQLATEEIPTLCRRALDNPGQILEDTLGKRVRVRVHFENGSQGILTVAISERLEPHGPSLPEDTYGYLLSAFFPMSESLSAVLEIGGQDLRPDEFAFCAWITGA